MAERTPPHDTAAETSVLGGMMLSADAADEVLTILTADDFYTPANATVFAAIADLRSHGQPADVLTVAAELRKAGELSRIGGAVPLHDMVSFVPTAANARWYATIVREAAVNRRLAMAGTSIAQLGYEAQGDAEANLATARKTLDAVESTVGGEDGGILLGDAVTEYLDILDSPTPAPPGWDWPWTDMNRVVLPLRRGQLVVFGGRPKMGKSSALLQTARHLAIHRGVPTLFYSLEMPRNEVVERIISAEAKVNLTAIRNGHLHPYDRDAIDRAYGSLLEAPLTIYCEKASLATLRAGICQHQAQAVAYDYLQLAPGCNGKDSSQRGTLLGQFAQGLKDLALSENVAMLTAAQLNRGPEQRADKRPVLADFRETGAIEQALDVGVMVHREDAYEQESPRAGEVDLLVLAQRNGPTDTVTLAHQFHYCRFVDMAQ